MPAVPWQSQHTSHCRACGREREPGETFSRRGKCDDCGEGRMIANRRELREHSGPFFVHWRRRTLAAFGIALVDGDDDQA